MAPLPVVFFHSAKADQPVALPLSQVMAYCPPEQFAAKEAALCAAADRHTLFARYQKPPEPGLVKQVTRWIAERAKVWQAVSSHPSEAPLLDKPQAQSESKGHLSAAGCPIATQPHHNLVGAAPKPPARGMSLPSVLAVETSPCGWLRAEDAR